jgi:hypothetical protein
VNIPKWTDFVTNTAIVSGVYIALVELTLLLVLPAQELFVSSYSSQVLLLYLPFGVRVLSAWLFGWWSFVYLLPGHLLAQMSFWGADGFTGALALSIFTGCAVGSIGVSLATILRNAFSIGFLNRDWKFIMCSGVLASFANSLLNTFIHGPSNTSPIAYLIGDIFGLWFLMLALIYILRVRPEQR